MEDFVQSLVHDRDTFATTAVILLLAFIVFLRFLTGLIKVVRQPNPRRALSDEEDEMLQKVWEGLQKMEERVMNLETILMRRTREHDYERRL